MFDRSAFRKIAITLLLGFGFAWAMAHLPVGTQFDAIRSVNGQIAFFGLVVDQVGRPLPGVQVRYRYSYEPGNVRGRGLSPEQTARESTITDDRGRFSVAGMYGRVLALESFSKDGYSPSPESPRVFAFYGSAAPAKPVTDPAHPLTFTMSQGVPGS